MAGTNLAPDQHVLPGPPDYRLLNDKPISLSDDQDVLRTGEVAERLTSLVLRSRDATPFTLAIDGGWGTGKSSLMQQIELRLKEQDADATECVWFNAWTARGGDALEGLIKSVLRRLDRNVLRRALYRAREHRSTMNLLRGAATLAFGFFHVGHLVDRLWEQWEVDAAGRNDLRRVMKALTDDWASGGGSGRPRRLLVVFVDDLDRCSDETVHAVLDAVKVYLDLPGLVFVLGFDQSRLARQPANPKAPGRRPDVSASYLEKIVQAGYRIPPPTARQAESLVLACARESGTDGLFTPHLAALLAARTGRNPRRLKRLINSFIMYQLDPAWQEFDPASVMRTVLLHQLYPEFHRAVSTPDSKDLIEDFVHYHRGRTLLSRTSPGPSDPAWPGLERLAEHAEVDRPPREDTAGWLKALAGLEGRLPKVFRELSADPDFVLLVTELYEAPDSEALRRRYQRLEPAEEPAEPEPGPDA
ncbi:P-loop NTPase fold protein [Kitasatospora sp. NPDC101183]|uniref:KAP family P-loop NTPase fold protein n=1 Tax=Kitasatospora sp. NPDC101183 TaxID=3364100 RepID=UPI003820BD01